MKPLDPSLLTDVAARFGTPVYVYDARVLRERVASLRRFDAIRFAQKACSNTHILRALREQGVLVDAVSLGEIERAVRESPPISSTPPTSPTARRSRCSPGATSR